MSALAKGDLVEVLDVGDVRDLRQAGDEALNCERFVGRVGRIVEVNTGAGWKVGNTPKDPLYVVHVPALGRDGFWAEELKKIG